MDGNSNTTESKNVFQSRLDQLYASRVSTHNQMPPVDFVPCQLPPGFPHNTLPTPPPLPPRTASVKRASGSQNLFTKINDTVKTELAGKNTPGIYTTSPYRGAGPGIQVMQAINSIDAYQGAGAAPGAFACPVQVVEEISSSYLPPGSGSSPYLHHALTGPLPGPSAGPPPRQTETVDSLDYDFQKLEVEPRQSRTTASQSTSEHRMQAFRSTSRLRSTEEIVIAIMGLTGSGKSTFITKLSDAQVELGHGLRSCKS
jgi:hypothetical protein